MELNQSSMVPFAVNDPVSGEDITKDIRLTGIEVGGQPSPYLIPNGDDTFSVIGADETDLTQPVTFKLQAPYEGTDYPLEATTDVTIKAALPTDKRFIVRFVGEHRGFAVVELNNTFHIDYQATWNGEFLGADEVKAAESPSNAWSKCLTIVKEEVLSDGITHRVTIKGIALGTHEWMLLNIQRLPVASTPITGVTEQGCSCYANVIPVGNTDLYLWIFPRYRTQYVTKNDKRIIFMDLYKGKIKISLSDPQVSITLNGINGTPNPFKFSKLNPEGPVYETIVSPSVETSYNTIFNITYQGATATGQIQVGVKYKYYDNTFSTQFKTTVVRPVVANSNMDCVWKAGNVNFDTIPYDLYTANGSIVDQGEVIGYDMTAFVEIWKQDIAGSRVNSIGELRTKHAVDYRKQLYNLQQTYLRAVLKTPDPTSPNGYQLIKLENYGYTVEAAPVKIVPNVTLINGTSGATNIIVLRGVQDRGNGDVFIPGTFSKFGYIGAGTLVGSTNLNDGSCYIQVNGIGSSGDVRISGTFTPTGGAAIIFDMQLTADTGFTVGINSRTVSVKIWDILDTPPFFVSYDGKSVTDSITNVRLVSDKYLKTLEDDPNKWEVIDSTTTGVTTKTPFLFDLDIDGVTHTVAGTGNYQIAAWNGVLLTNTVDYGLGVGVTTEIPVSRNNTNRITVWPVYKGKPLKDGFSGLVTIGSWFTADFRIVGLAEDGAGVVIEYTAPDTSGPASNSSSLTITIDGTPGTTTNKDRWVGGFTGIYVTKGLYVLPITLVPSTQPFARPYSWDAKIYYSGVLLKPNDPRLSYEISNAGSSEPIIGIVGIEERYVWFALNTNPGSAGTYINRLYVTYNDGVKPPEGSGYIDLRATFSTTTLVPVMMNPLEEPVGNTDNIIPVEFKRGTGVIGKPSTIRTFSGKGEPENGNALIGELVLIDDPTDNTRNAIKFKSGWTGGKIAVSMIGDWTPTLSDNWIVRDAELTVPAVAVTVTQMVNEIDGIDGRTTEVRFTLSQPRVGETETITYKFPTATISPTGIVTGAIKGAYDATNNNGTFSVVMHGNGTQGPGTVTLTVTDPDGFEYPVILAVDAVIDSSQLVMTPITPSSISGKAGTVTTMSGKTTYDGSTILDWNNGSGNVHYSIEPEGWAEFTNPTKDSFDLKIIRNSDVDISHEVFVVCNFLGMIAKQPVTVNVVKNMDTNAIVQNVEVWGRYTGYPFVLKAGEEDITNTILDAKPVNDDLVIPIQMENKSKPAVNMWTIKGVNFANDPARTEVVTWQYRLPTDPVETVRTVDVVYNIAAYDGYSLTAITSKPYYTGVPLSQFQADFFVYRYAEPVKDNPTNLGAVSSPIINSNSYTNFEGQGRFQFQVINNASVIDKYGIPNTYKIKVGTGNIPGQDVINVAFITNTYNPNNNSALTDFQPNPLVGKFGEEIPATVKVWRNGNPNELTQANLKDPIFTPTGIMEMVPGSRNNEGFLVRFITDIDVNSKETEVTIRMPYATETGGSTKFIAKQMATVLKLTQAPGFQTSGSGDMENPVTLQQSVLNPE